MNNPYKKRTRGCSLPPNIHAISAILHCADTRATPTALKFDNKPPCTLFYYPHINHFTYKRRDSITCYDGDAEGRGRP